MIRMLSFLVVLTGLLALPLSASALGISVLNISSTGASTSVLEDGDVVTIDLRVENSGGVALNGAGIAVGGYDINQNGVTDDPLVVTGGIVPSSMFNAVVVPGPPAQFFGGLSNVNAGIKYVGDPGDPTPGPTFQAPIITHAVLFEGVTTAPGGVNGTGSVDPGVDGGLTSTEAHFRVTIQAVTAGVGPAGTDITVDFGALSEFGQVIVGTDSSVLPFNNASLTFTVVPEPGTALLMGLGLAGLAGSRRR
jgi:hypothetical protein